MKNYLCISLLLVFLASKAQNRAIKFETGSWSQVKAKAQKESKPIFVDAYTTWCGPCKWMAKTVFTNDTVADYFNNHFINVSMDMEKEEGIELAKQWEVRAYPTLMFFNGDGEMLHRACGASPPDVLIQKGQTALRTTTPFSTDRKKYESGASDPEFLAVYIQKLKNACVPYDKECAKYFASQKEEELTTTRNWEMIKDFINDMESREFRYLHANRQKFEALYPKEEVSNKIIGVYSDALMSAINKDSAKHYPEVKAKVIEYLPEDGEKMSLYPDVLYYERIKNWEQYAIAAELNIKNQGEGDCMLLNEAAWGFYEHIDHPALLEKALDWVKKSMDIQTNYFNVDTYAAILYKLGRKKEAKEAAEKAIALAREDKEDFSETAALLKKIKAMK